MRATTIRRLKQLLTVTLAAAILVALPAGIALAEEDCQGRIIVIDPGDTGAPGQLRTAIAEVCDGGTVDIDATVTDPILVHPEITIDKTVTVEGSGQTIQTGSWAYGVFHVEPTGNLKLAGVTLRGDGAWSFRGLEVEGHATLTDVILTHFTCAVWAQPGSSVTLDGSTLVTGNIVDRDAEGGAGIYNDGGSVTLKDDAAVTENCNYGCFAPPGIPAGVLAFGAIFNRYGSITLEDHAVVSDNWIRECDTSKGYYGGRGGGIASWGGSITLSDQAQVSGNTARFAGGIYGLFTVLTINDHAGVIENTAIGGAAGGVFNGSGVVTLNDKATITGNTAQGNGGGVYNSQPSGGYPAPVLVINNKAAITGNTPNDIYPTQ